MSAKIITEGGHNKGVGHIFIPHFGIPTRLQWIWNSPETRTLDSTLNSGTVVFYGRGGKNGQCLATIKCRQTFVEFVTLLKLFTDNASPYGLQLGWTTSVVPYLICHCLEINYFLKYSSSYHIERQLKTISTCFNTFLTF